MYGYKAGDWFDVPASVDWLEVRAVEVVRLAEERMLGTLQELSGTTDSVHWVDNGTWNIVRPNDWTMGFLPGCLWLLYDLTGDPAYLQEAIQRTMARESQKTNTRTHDLGFMLGIPFMAGYNATGEAYYRDVAVASARSLATRYNSVSGCIDSWSHGVYDDSHETIIDNMMNLELLFWAADQPWGNPQWFNMAVSHTDRTMEEFICENGATTHVIFWDAVTGEVQSRRRDCTLYPEDELFARGQGWAIYGFTMAYRFTGNPAYIDAAVKLTEFYFETANADGVPYWSLTKPGIAPNLHLDASTAAITAAGLLELAIIAEEESTRDYALTGARYLLETLFSDAYLANTPGNGLLDMAANGIDFMTETALIYGDYYLLEAIKRFLQLKEHPVNPGN